MAGREARVDGPSCVVAEEVEEFEAELAVRRRSWEEREKRRGG